MPVFGGHNQQKRGAWTPIEVPKRLDPLEKGVRPPGPGSFDVLGEAFQVLQPAWKAQKRPGGPKMGPQRPKKRASRLFFGLLRCPFFGKTPRKEAINLIQSGFRLSAFWLARFSASG
jgi:hypothetical protein